MSDVLSKPLSDLRIEDVEALIDEGYPEGSTVEFKEGLSHPTGGRDKWYSGAASISNGARDKILRELVAFANAHGGTLLLGIEESSEKPARAAAINPVPRCHDLADRLRLQLRDCVEPKIPLVSAEGIELGEGAEPGSGVVALRVERSYLAPHRLETKSECYIRRADRSEKMTMWEIQDLTLQTERGSARLDSIFSQRQNRFYRSLGMHLGRSQRGAEYAWMGVRVTAAPVWPLFVEKVHGDHAVFPQAKRMVLNDRSREWKLVLPEQPLAERPLVRGSRRTPGNNSVVHELFCDGLAEITIIKKRSEEREHALDAHWILAAVGNVLATLDAFRSTAGMPGFEFALDVEIAQTSGDVTIGWFDEAGRLQGEPAESPCRLPRISVGDRERFADILGMVFSDLENASGLEAWGGPFTLKM